MVIGSIAFALMLACCICFAYNELTGTNNPLLHDITLFCLGTGVIMMSFAEQVSVEGARVPLRIMGIVTDLIAAIFLFQHFYKKTLRCRRKMWDKAVAKGYTFWLHEKETDPNTLDKEIFVTRNHAAMFFLHDIKRVVLIHHPAEIEETANEKH